MTDYRQIMKRVGKVLIIVGLIDIGFMVYCIVSGRGYSSSLNIFAVIAGVFLWRGSLRAARLVARYAAFGLAAGVGACLFLMPFMRPAGLWAAEFNLQPVATLLSVVMVAVLLALLAWSYRELRAPTVIAALVEAGEDSRPPTRYFAIGAALPLVLAVVFHFTLSGAMGAKAIGLAKLKYGDTYQYSPTSIRQGGNHTQVSLEAYNAYEIRSVSVDW